MKSYAAVILGIPVLAIGLSPTFVQATDQETTTLPPCPLGRVLEFNMPYVQHNPFSSDVSIRKTGITEGQKPLTPPAPLEPQESKPATHILCIDAVA